MKTKNQIISEILSRVVSVKPNANIYVGSNWATMAERSAEQAFSLLQIACSLTAVEGWTDERKLLMSTIEDILNNPAEVARLGQPSSSSQ